MLDQHALDGIIGFSDDGGEVWRSRRIVDNPRIEMMGEGTWPVLAGAWDVFGDGEVKCETWLVPPPPTAAGMETGKEHWYVRVHRVSIAPGCRHLRDGKLLSAEASWAVYGQGSDARILTLTSASAASSEDSSESQSLPDVTSGAAYAVSVGGAVGLFPTSMGKRAAEVLAVDANASLIWPRTVLPTLRGGLGEGERWFVTGVFGRRVVRGWKREWDAVGEGWEGMVPAELRRRIVVG